MKIVNSRLKSGMSSQCEREEALSVCPIASFPDLSFVLGIRKAGQNQER